MSARSNEEKCRQYAAAGHTQVYIHWMQRGAVLALARSVGVVGGVVVLTFVLLHLAPGDPATQLLGAAATPAQIAAAHHALGMDQTLLVQFMRWVGGVVRGDFGISIATGRPVASLLAEAWPATASLVLLSLSLTYVLGVAIGAWQSNLRHRVADRAATAVVMGMNAMPGYWLGLVLILVFTYRLHLLPAFGAAALDADFLSPVSRAIDRLRHLALPLITLTLIGAGGIARFVRVSMRDVRDAPFLVAASARGLTRARVLWRHQLRNALVPVVTLLGLSLPAFFSGTVFVEAVFAWPGVGQLMVRGVQARDYPVVLASATIAAVLVVVGNLLADLLVWVADPRTRTRAADVAL